MDISLFEYNLPKELIANNPVSPRDHSRLMTINRNTEEIEDHYFYEILDFLQKGDVLVFNQTKVFPARLIGTKDTGGKVEILLTKNISKNTWQAMRKGTLKIEQVIHFNEVSGIIKSLNENLVEIEFNIDEEQLHSFLVKSGLTPLPPYIESKLSEKNAREIYQTVYAKNEGSVAAPTAGFHFTDELLNKIKAKGIETEFVTLHVGLGTFLPITQTDITKHIMHSEYYSIDNLTFDRLTKAKKQGKRIIAIGTTTTRVLESMSADKLSGETNIFIYPPYKFKFVEALITNFHLPHSTLLALVSAFTTYPNTKHKFKNFIESPIGKAYLEAIEKNYRFYSFGDACLIY